MTTTTTTTTSSTLQDKGIRPRSDAVSLETTILIQRMYRHILNDNCDHCRHILRGNKNND
jgi:hypothetical protein